ncbi:MAG: LamG domain-containing protein, partial [Pirellulales bacterium]|nr:LamG domain-containing protein [Pirellulales bacterium]
MCDRARPSADFPCFSRANRASRWIALVLLGVLALAIPLRAADDDGLIAHYTFDEGSGETLKDQSGHGFDGTIHGAQWVRDSAGNGTLGFGPGDYVDLGNRPELNPAGDRAVAAWVQLQAPSYPAVGTNWVILDGGDDYAKSGYLLRVDGNSTKLSYRHNVNGSASDVLGRSSIPNNTYSFLVVTRSGPTTSVYIDGKLDVQCPFADAVEMKRPATLSQAVQSFAGLMDDLAIYRRALSTGEILAMYEQGAAAHGKDASWIGHIRLTPYCHDAQGSILVEADFAGVLPLKAGEKADFELRPAGGKAIKTEPIAAMPDGGRCQCTFAIGNLAAGKYEVAAVLKDAAGAVVHQSAAAFAYPYAPAEAPSPARQVVP